MRVDSATQIEDLASTLAGILRDVGSTVLLDLQAIWTLNDVCAYYRLGRDTVRKFMARGLPYIKIGNEYKFERLRVKRFFERLPR